MPEFRSPSTATGQAPSCLGQCQCNAGGDPRSELAAVLPLRLLGSGGLSLEKASMSYQRRQCWKRCLEAPEAQATSISFALLRHSQRAPKEPQHQEQPRSRIQTEAAGPSAEAGMERGSPAGFGTSRLGRQLPQAAGSCQLERGWGTRRGHHGSGASRKQGCAGGRTAKRHREAGEDCAA